MHLQPNGSLDRSFGPQGRALLVGTYVRPKRDDGIVVARYLLGD